ncbi:hypothetical protein SMMN14_00322 [Sphaerulina musiva]
MTYNAQREERLRRLGIEQLPPLTACSSFESDTSTCSLIAETSSLTIGMSGVRERPVPGKKCPSCISRGQTIWVIQGKRCPQCGTEVL